MARRIIRKTFATVVRSFGDPVWPAPVPGAGHEALECPHCHSHFLCPIDWGTKDDSHWWIVSRCGECGEWSEIVISDEQAARLDCELDRQATSIQRAAARLEAERMAAEVETFVAALRGDLIDADDFA